MSATGEVGMDIHLDRVPLRQQDMEPFEILYSESQGRMLVVVHQGQEDEVKAILRSGTCTPSTSAKSPKATAFATS